MKAPRAGLFFKWYWNANGHESGRFDYQSRSVNHQWNAMSDFLNIG
ncbi:MAG: hypothetical protein JW881_07965 [Spirochaetales bacterium]|nr:hypothetical protein [Spirochaetales bacterium]